MTPLRLLAPESCGCVTYNFCRVLVDAATPPRVGLTCETQDFVWFSCISKVVRNDQLCVCDQSIMDTEMT